MMCLKLRREKVEKSEKLAVDFKGMCELLSIGANTGRDLIRTNGFPLIELSSKKHIFPVSGLMAWLEKQTGGESFDNQ